MNDNAIVKLDAARLALAECKTAMEAKHIADMAEAARVYLERTQASVETVNRATEIRLLAERQMGEFLKQMPKNKGGRPIESETTPEQGKDYVPTMKELGIPPKQAERANELADIPAGEFNQRLEDVKQAGDRITRAAIVKAQRVRTIWSRSIWERQTRSVMTSWLESVPDDDRRWAAKFLSDLPTSILHQINK